MTITCGPKIDIFMFESYHVKLIFMNLIHGPAVWLLTYDTLCKIENQVSKL